MNVTAVETKWIGYGGYCRSSRSRLHCSRTDYSISNYWALRYGPLKWTWKFMEPIGQKLKSVGKFMDSAVNLMNKSFIDRKCFPLNWLGFATARYFMRSILFMYLYNFIDILGGVSRLPASIST
ncbi:hypothetical protein K7X08_007123 [Anisodus acutangulus]|uniref:Uncharacterized protein n=1 Tax=Anisodus acutangulus TaxID=402998 RepID=A0A9Q1LC24_9SOLA|nr:hypothetical protein K7X08_007123 [Anisodus acutangulus]